MKAKLLERRNPFDKSFNSAIHEYPHFLNVWHYHTELELVYILKSTGTRFIGDSIRPFEAGELVLIGEGLPHMWQNDPEYFEKDSDLKAEAITLHFRKDFGGREFLEMTEMLQIQHLLETAGQGMVFTEEVASKVKEMMLQIHQTDGFQRLIFFLELLQYLAVQREFELLSTKGFSNPAEKTGDLRIDKVYAYTFNNFRKNITLDQVADVANLNPTAFCRFFKKHTKKNYSKFLNEIRIGFACKLLLEERLNISEVGYESGFNNLSNFNRQFKSMMGLSPSQFLSKHQVHK
ncbi:transcriptional regulator [Indibacter alkaliphilus LW1]|jgi:AraC-like DNA-binding protein|uniref:Transcriptional regulator n=1 Tax=Indibacter alkaliphilus (strain CCUG 57479 / KCTC 22604 / LW1) TaxID=1189612 RepID=S2D887_INDAL|nr:AraC family transcriptional regulator [Indibacter alkaliphilus]EOZ95427.1 transcriptional regulator [Indibacter alkaliphilus LW1]